MDIRGAGNLLGDEQSGHVREVGVELYQEMLRQAVEAARGGDTATEGDIEWTPQLNLGLEVRIPEDYVADLTVRLSLYRHIANMDIGTEADGLVAELVDGWSAAGFGAQPDCRGRAQTAQQARQHRADRCRAKGAVTGVPR